MVKETRYPIIPGPVPFMVERTAGRHLFTSDGRQILDAGGGAVVANIGYGREEVAAVAAQAMQQVTYVLPPWPTPAREALLERVIDHWMPDHITRGGFTSGGSEAIETALRLARQHHLSAGRTGRWRAIGRRPSYHGVTLGTLALGGHADRRRGFEPMFPGFVQVPWDDADALEATISELGPDTVSAFVAEPVVGSSAGALVAPPEYWRQVTEICRNYGVLFILDEVMTGFGRTGERMGLDRYGLQPDIVVSGKGLGGGYVPIGGVFTSEEVVAPIAANRDSLMFFTYGAQDLACAVADEVLRILDAENLVERAATQGATLTQMLTDALGDHPAVIEIRGPGLMVGVEFAAPHMRHRRVVSEALRRDVWIYPANSGPDSPDAVLFGPAFTVTDEELDTMVSVLVEAVEQTATG